MTKIRGIVKAVGALTCSALIATTCSNVEPEQADPGLPELPADAGASDVGFIDVGENDFDEPPLVVPVDPLPIEDWPEGVLAVGEGLDVTLPAPAEAPISVTLALPPRPTEDALPAAIWERDDGTLEIVRGYWDQTDNTITLETHEFTSFRSIWQKLEDWIRDAKDWIGDAPERLASFAKNWADWAVDSVTGRTNPPECSNNAPPWVSIGEHPNWVHTCLQSSASEDTSEVLAELVIKSNRRYIPIAAETDPSAAYFEVDDQPDDVRRALAFLTGLDVEHGVLLPWGGSYRMGFAENPYSGNRLLPVDTGPTWRTFLFGVVVKAIEESTGILLGNASAWLPVALTTAQCLAGLDVFGLDLDPNFDFEQLLRCVIEGIGDGFDQSKAENTFDNVGKQIDGLMEIAKKKFPELSSHVITVLPVIRELNVVREIASVLRDTGQVLHDIWQADRTEPIWLTLHDMPATTLPVPAFTAPPKPAPPATSAVAQGSDFEAVKFEGEPMLTIQPSVVVAEGFDYEFTYTGSGWQPNQTIGILPISSNMIDLFSVDPYSFAFSWFEVTPDADGEFTVARTAPVLEGGLSFIVSHSGQIDFESRRLHPGVTVGQEGASVPLPKSSVKECLVRCDVSLAVYPTSVSAPGAQEFTITASGEIHWGQLTVCGVDDWSTFRSSDANCELVEESVSATRGEPFEITFEFDVLSEGLWIQLEDYAGDISHAVLSERVWVGGEPRPTVSVNPSGQASGPTRFSVSGSGFTHPVFVIPCSPIERWPSFNIEAECDLTSSTATHVGRDGDFSVSVSYDVPPAGLGVVAVTDAARTEAAYVNIPGRGSLR